MWSKKTTPSDILSVIVGKGVSPKLGENESGDICKSPKQTYYYMGVCLTERSLEEISVCVGECVRVLLAHNAVVHTLISTFIFVSFEGNGSKMSAFRANEALLGRFGGKIRIVYGQVETCYINLGSGPALRYSLVIPHFDQVLGLLVATDGGKSAILDLDF